MPPDESAEEDPAARREPVGAPVVRGDPEIAGERAPEAAQFDPDDPESLERAAEIVRTFEADIEASIDQFTMLRGAAACAALVRGSGSYAAAADRAGGDVDVPFLRKWSRVHDLPISIRRHIARGDIAPSTAMHIARVTGRARFLLAWAHIDQNLSVRTTNEIASAIKDGTSIEDAFQERGINIGEITLSLPLPIYRELRRRASLRNDSPETIIEDLLRREFDSEGVF